MSSFRANPKALEFTYNSSKHEQTRQDLTRLLTKLNNSLEGYLKDGIPFTHTSKTKKNCPYCRALVSTQGTFDLNDRGIKRDWGKSIADIGGSIPLRILDF